LYTNMWRTLYMKTISQFLGIIFHIVRNGLLKA
jgi:hypothetical protein